MVTVGFSLLTGCIIVLSVYLILTRKELSEKRFENMELKSKLSWSEYNLKECRETSERNQREANNLKSQKDKIIELSKDEQKTQELRAYIKSLEPKPIQYYTVPVPYVVPYVPYGMCNTYGLNPLNSIYSQMYHPSMTQCCDLRMEQARLEAMRCCCENVDRRN